MNNVPLIGQQQKQVQMQIAAVMQQMSFGIYTQLAVAEINSVGTFGEVDQERLKALAKLSQTATLAYFEAMEIIERT